MPPQTSLILETKGKKMKKRKKAKVISIKTRKASKKFPDYCTGYYRENPEVEKLACPRCADMLPNHDGALSWDGETEICPACGDIEGYEAMLWDFKEYDPYRECNQQKLH